VVLDEISAEVDVGIAAEVVAGRLNSCGVVVTMGALTLVLEVIAAGGVI